MKTLIPIQNAQNPESAAPTQPPSEGIRICCNKIGLNPQIQAKHFAGCLIHYFMISFIFVSIDLLQPMLLFQKFTIKRSDQFHNMKNAGVTACDIAIKILVAPLFGFLTDKIGRKIVNAYGIVIISIAMVIIPFCLQYWQYILTRIFYAHGAIAISVVPLLADYIHNDSKGAISALLVLMSALGALASAELNTVLLSKITSSSKITIQYLVAAGIIFVVGLFYSLYCIKSGTDYYEKKKERRTCKKMCEMAKQSMKSPELSLSYASAFLARSGSILLSMFLVLWVYSFNPDQSEYDKANTQSSVLSGITYVVIMVSCIAYGFLFHIGKHLKWVVVAMLGLTAIGSFLVNAAMSANSGMMYVSLVVLGLGMGGLYTAALYLLNAFVDQQNRGYITGLQTWSGTLGICIVTVIGAVLIDNTTRSGAFNLFGALSLLFIPITFILYRNASSVTPQTPSPQPIPDLPMADQPSTSSIKKNDSNGQTTI